VAVTAIPPGEDLAEELKELGMSAAELARQLDVPTNRVTEILNGKRAVTGDTALRAAHCVVEFERQCSRSVQICHLTR
jgi:addiction module HigA family antidote